MSANRSMNKEGIETMVFSKTEGFAKPYLNSSRRYRGSYNSGEKKGDSISNKLINNKITWESKKSRPITIHSNHTPESKISTGGQFSHKPKINDYQLPNKHLINTMEKVFNNQKPINDLEFSSKLIRNNMIGVPQRSSMKSLSQDRMTRSQHMPKSSSNYIEPQLIQTTLGTSTSRKFIQLITPAQRDNFFKQQIQLMKYDFGKFMHRRKQI